MKVQKNRSIDPNGNVLLDLNSAVYSINAGCNITCIQLDELSTDEISVFNKYCTEFGYEEHIFNTKINHEQNHNLWKYDSYYDKINLTDYFLNLCSIDEEKERVLYELTL